MRLIVINAEDDEKLVIGVTKRYFYIANDNPKYCVMSRLLGSRNYGVINVPKLVQKLQINVRTFAFRPRGCTTYVAV